MRLTLVISTLAVGGAQRVLTLLANHWAESGHQVTLVVLDGESAPPFFPLRPQVTRRALDLTRPSENPLVGLQQNRQRIQVLRRALRESRAEAVVSFMATTNVKTLLASVGLNVPVIISERLNPAHSARHFVWRAARRMAYPQAAASVAQTEREAAILRAALGAKVRVIPNPVLPVEAADAPDRVKTGNNLVAAGRLEAQKGFDVLLRAFAPLSEAFPDWTLTIWGEGRQRAALEGLSRELQIRDRVFLPGRTASLNAELRRADLFVLPSRYEGFPNVLGEAMACGLPVIAADCDFGPRELVRDGVDGVLVPSGDVTALTAEMKRLMADGAERRRLAARASEVTSRFGLPQILRAWDDVLCEVTATRVAAERVYA